MTLTFTIPGEPVAQGRPRFARMGSFVRTYDPKESRDWKATVKQFAIAAGAAPIPGPLRLEVVAVFTRPLTSYRKRAPRGPEPKTTKPDLSNVLKGIEDALLGIAYLDDSQVAEIVARKLVGGQGEAPATTVTVRRLSD